MQLSDQAEEALLSLLSELRRQNYSFVAPTPETHRRVVARPDKQQARDVRDIFGWSLPFAPDLAPTLRELLARAGALEQEGSLLRSALRVSSVGANLFLHSAFPTIAEDSVFFGPDSYRFVSFLRDELPRAGAVRRVVDLGCGSGVGAIMTAPFVPDARLTLVDSNAKALRLAAINARSAGVRVELVEADAITQVDGLIDLVIANPPYITDDGERTYRDGGDMHGARISLDWTLASTRRLKQGGRLLLYTGAAVIAGRDALKEALEAKLPALGCTLRYAEIDPDVFGEELEKPAYADVERIAVIGAVIERR